MTNPIFNSLLEVLRELYHGVSVSLRAAMTPHSHWAVFVLLGFSCLYGVFHILLPGHQKAVISAYFLSENARYGQGFLAGGVFALFHAVAATAIPFVLREILQLTLGKTNELSGHWAQIISVWGILLIALILFAFKLQKIPELRRRATLTKIRRRMGFDLHDRLETAFEPVPWRRLLPFLFFAAVIPCPDTLVFLVALSRGAVGLGLAAVAAMTIGMAVTLTVIALAVIAAKKTGRFVTKRRERWLGQFLLESVGLLILIAFALVLFSTTSASPLG